MAIKKFASATNTPLALYTSLTSGAHATIRRNGDDWMREHVVPRMVGGEWSGTMCLTEPHCGTDLRLMKTRATPQADGTFRISGTKIFITGGDQDITENIVHLVLAKFPNEAGKYTDDLAGVHLFLIPKFEIDPASGRMGGRNRVAVSGIEHKMGLRGSATCVLNFDGALGYRVSGVAKASSEHRARASVGMSGMFEMMNSARLGTGVTAFGCAQRAYDHAAAYARQRLAGRAAARVDRGVEAADPLVVHPDVRRLLLKQVAFIEGARAFALFVRGLLDEPDLTRRAPSLAMAELLTPVVKAYCSDRAFESANDALQVLGGHGYIRESGVEQIVRDTRLLQLFEGANGVQALDLVQRKLPANAGQAFVDFLELAAGAAAQANRHEKLCEMAVGMLDAVDHAHGCAAWLGSAAPEGYDGRESSYDFLSLLGTLACGFMWLKIASAVLDSKLADTRSTFAKRKLTLARYWFEREMPLIGALRTKIEAGSAVMMSLAPHEF